MNKNNFPFVALGIGLILLLIVMKGGEIRVDGTTAIPLLTLLVVSEFAFFVTAVGAYIGIKHILAVGLKQLYALVTHAMHAPVRRLFVAWNRAMALHYLTAPAGVCL